MPKLPGVNHLQAVRALQKTGFWVAREGKHVVMTNGARLLTIPRHNPVNAITMGNKVLLNASCFALVEGNQGYPVNPRPSPQKIFPGS